MFEAMAKNYEWLECKYCSYRLAKLFFTQDGIVFEVDGIKGQKFYFDPSFFITDCPKCHRKNSTIQFGGQNKFKNFDLNFLGGEAWEMISNPATNKKLRSRLTGTEKEILNAFQNPPSRLHPDYWMVELSQVLNMPVKVFMEKWGSIVNKIIELENEVKID